MPMHLDRSDGIPFVFHCVRALMRTIYKYACAGRMHTHIARDRPTDRQLKTKSTRTHFGANAFRSEFQSIACVSVCALDCSHMMIRCADTPREPMIACGYYGLPKTNTDHNTGAERSSQVNSSMRPAIQLLFLHLTCTS